MKRVIHSTTLLLITGILVLSGCYLKSVHPLVTEEQAKLMPGLEGRWEDSEQRWTFINDPRNLEDLSSKYLDFEFDPDEEIEEQYYLVIHENLEAVPADTTYLFGYADLFGDHYFINFGLIDPEEDSNFKDSFLFPVQLFARTSIKSEELLIEFFEDDWIKDMIENNRIRIKHERTSEGILITASNKELRAFVNAYGNDDEAFDDPLTLERQ